MIYFYLSHRLALFNYKIHFTPVDFLEQTTSRYNNERLLPTIKIQYYDKNLVQYHLQVV